MEGGEQVTLSKDEDMEKKDSGKDTHEKEETDREGGNMDSGKDTYKKEETDGEGGNSQVAMDQGDNGNSQVAMDQGGNMDSGKDTYKKEETDGEGPSVVTPVPKVGARKKQSLEEKKAVHRRACERWHAKWLSKGVLRKPDKKASPKKNNLKKKEEIPKKTQKKSEKKPACAAGAACTTRTRKPKTLPKEISEALVLDNMEHLLPDTNDLRSTKGAFIKAYVDMLTQKENEGISSGSSRDTVMMTKGEKHKKGSEMWMSSALRGVLMSGKDKGFAAIPCSLVMP